LTVIFLVYTVTLLAGLKRAVNFVYPWRKRLLTEFPFSNQDKATTPVRLTAAVVPQGAKSRIAEEPPWVSQDAQTDAKNLSLAVQLAFAP